MSLRLSLVTPSTTDSDPVGLVDVYESMLDFSSVYQQFVDYRNCCEIMYSVKKHSSSECYALATDLLGVSLESISVSSEGFKDAFLKAWNGFVNMWKRFFKWIRRQCRKLSIKIRKLFRKKKKPADKSNEKPEEKKAPEAAKPAEKPAPAAKPAEQAPSKAAPAEQAPAKTSEPVTKSVFPMEADFSQAVITKMVKFVDETDEAIMRFTSVSFMNDKNYNGNLGGTYKNAENLRQGLTKLAQTIKPKLSTMKNIAKSNSPKYVISSEENACYLLDNHLAHVTKMLDRDIDALNRLMKFHFDAQNTMSKSDSNKLLSQSGILGSIVQSYMDFAKPMAAKYTAFIAKLSKAVGVTTDTTASDDVATKAA